MRYVALLRGINVGGKNMVRMAELKPCLEKVGLNGVRTYIQSGNILFESDETDKTKLVTLMEQAIIKEFGHEVPVVLLTHNELENIATSTPKGWMENPEFKYNYIFLKPPYDINKVVEAIGVLKPDIESVTVGEGVLYQSMSIKLFGRTTTGKLASNPIYKIMTFRNHNTVTKLLELSKGN